jgi:hypothetical protein
MARLATYTLGIDWGAAVVQDTPAAPSTPKASVLTDTFRSASSVTWPGKTSGTSAVGWRGRVTMPGTVGPTEKWSTEPNRYDLTSSSFAVEWAQLPTSTGAVGVHAIAGLSPENRVMIGREGGNLLMRKVEAGTVSDTTLTYDAVFHRWVRLNHDGTNVLWQTSDNGTTWTTRRTATTTVNLASVYFTLEGTWQTSVGGGRLEFANVNTSPVTALTYSPPPYHFGTLRTVNDTFTDKADDEQAGGTRIGHYEIYWDRAEGTNGTFSSSYATQIASETGLIRSAGLKLAVGLGLHYPPAWTFTDITNPRLVNEAGGTSSALNYVFNQLVRDQAEQYLSWINSQVGFNNVWNIHLTSGVDGEWLYPPAGGSPSGGLWGYDLNAKGTASNLPATVAPSPSPTWTPGTGTVGQATEWLSWYLDSLADAVNWQIRLLRQTYGYTGWISVMTPGSGTRPSLMATELGNRLTGYSATTGVGAVWLELYKRIVDRHGVIAYCSSMADGSGTSPNDVPTGTDTSTAVTSSTADAWSAYRWIARLSSEFGLPLGGENPGFPFYTNSATAATLMDATLAQAVGTPKALATMWAHSEKLWDGTSSFATWSSKIGAKNTTGAGTPPNPPS